MNQVLPSDNMQFNNELLVPSSVFVGGFSSEIPNSSLAHDVSSNVGNRMRGMVRSGVITPMASPVVSNALEYVLKTTNFKSILLGEKVTGVSAGDTYLEDKEDVQEKEELKPKEEEIFSMPWLLEDNNNIIQPNPPKLKPEGDITFENVAFNHPSSLSDEAIEKEFWGNIGSKTQETLVSSYKLVDKYFKKSIKVGLGYVDTGLQLVSKFEKEYPLASALIGGQVESGFAIVRPFMFAGQKIIDYTCRDQFDNLVNDYVVDPVLEFAGISNTDKEYNAGKFTVKTIAEFGLLKKFDNKVTQKLYSYEPRIELHRTGVKYEYIDRQKSVRQIDLNKISETKVKKFFVKEGHELSEINKINNLFEDTKSWVLKPEVINELKSMNNLEIRSSKVIKELTRDGSLIDDWKKFRTNTINIGDKKVSIHLYKNTKTGEINRNIDYKFHIDNSKKKKK